MTLATTESNDLDRLFPSVWAIVHDDGSFEPLPAFEPGALELEILIVRDDDSLEPFDAIGWQRGASSPWWLRNRAVVCLGYSQIEQAQWTESPILLVSTPQRWLDRHGDCVCILDWSADIRSLFGDVPEVACESRTLQKQLVEVLAQQAQPRFSIWCAA